MFALIIICYCVERVIIKTDWVVFISCCLLLWHIDVVNQSRPRGWKETGFDIQVVSCEKVKLFLLIFRFPSPKLPVRSRQTQIHKATQ